MFICVIDFLHDTLISAYCLGCRASHHGLCALTRVPHGVPFPCTLRTFPTLGGPWLAPCTVRASRGARTIPKEVLKARIDCVKTHPRAGGNWQLEHTHSGALRCEQSHREVLYVRERYDLVQQIWRHTPTDTHSGFRGMRGHIHAAMRRCSVGYQSVSLRSVSSRRIASVIHRHVQS